MLHLHECAEPAPAESAAEPLHSVCDSATIEESAIEPFLSADDPTAAKSAAELLKSVADLDAVADASTETSYS
jgi:hypothetical protein